MINKEVAKLINEQATKEILSGYLYLAMAFQAEDLRLKGFANWLYVQHQEEYAHALHMTRYLVDQGQRVNIGDLILPKRSWGTPLEIAQGILEHEKMVTESLHHIMQVAVSEVDFASQAFLQWYINEQVEEEANATHLVTLFERADSDSALLFVDDQLSKRVFNPPFPVNGVPL